MRLVKSLCILVLFSSAITACGAPKHMVQSAAAITPDAEMATIVFYRHTKFGGAIASGVFEVTAPETTFVGTVRVKGKVVAKVPPGKHTFMVLGENADFAYADVEAGHVYHMGVIVRMGVWKARFSLNPVTKEEYSDPSFAKVEECVLYEKSAESEAWFAKHKADIEKKRGKYMEKWMSKAEGDRPGLKPEDHQ